MAGTEEDAVFEPEQELALSDANERLPWLESDDDDVAPAGVDSGRLAAFAVVGLMVVGLLLGGLWYLTRDRPDQSQVADGSMIAAPAGPYKVKPSDPGGRKVAGTGDTSFQVAEGKGVDGHIATGVKPAVTPTPTSSAKPTDKPSAAPTASPGGIGVQVAAYANRALAEAGWTQLSGRLPPLNGRSHRVVEGVADSGTVFRLQAVAGTVAEAEALCRSIKTAGGDCQVKR